MSRSQVFIALFLNLLGIPGAGQWYLKEKKRGAFFMGLVIIVLFALFLSLTTVLQHEFASPEMVQTLQTLSQDSSNSTEKLFTLIKPLSENLSLKYDSTFRIYIFLIGSLYIASLVDVLGLYWSRKS
jgi:TM2 domain-containing membrane protein YozV